MVDLVLIRNLNRPQLLVIAGYEYHDEVNLVKPSSCSLFSEFKMKELMSPTRPSVS